MAAVLPFLEAPPTEAEVAEANTAIALSGLGASKGKHKEKPPALDADGKLLPVLAKPHSELTSLMWARAAILKELSTRTMSLERIALPHLHPQAAQYFIRITPPLPTNIVPWWGISGEREPAGTWLFSDNNKMRCPTFDLPAGSAPMGGSCPGATAGQSVVPKDTREAAARVVERYATRYNLLTGKVEPSGYRIESAICEYCYATGGKFAETSTQIKQLIVYGFIRRMMERNPNQLRQILFEGVLGSEGSFKTGGKYFDKTSRFNFLPVRVHSSGDFFSPEYARVWIDVAWMLLANERNGGRAVRLWSPTRTQVGGAGFQKLWTEAMSSSPGAKVKVPLNYSIRPSAWHIGDMAPTPIVRLWDLKGSDPFNESARFPVLDANGNHVEVQGSSVFHASVAEQYKGTAYDFQCGTYALDRKEGKSCALSNPPMDIPPGPGGVEDTGKDPKEGCRACWIRPDLRVNYAYH